MQKTTHLDFLNRETISFSRAAKLHRLAMDELGINICYQPITGKGERSIFFCMKELTKKQITELEFFCKGALAALRSI